MKRQSPIQRSVRDSVLRSLKVRRGRASGWIVVVIALLVIGLGVAFVIHRQTHQAPGEQGNGQSELDPVQLKADREEEAKLLSLALRELESLRTKSALATIEKLEALYERQGWPGDSSLVLQWKVVALLYAMTAPPDDVKQRAASEVMEAPQVSAELLKACQALQKKRPEKADTHTLLARSAVALAQRGDELPADFPTAVASVKQAQSLNGESSAAAYEWIRLADDAGWIRDAEVQTAAREAAQKGHKLDPSNLAMLSEALLRTAGKDSATFAALVEDATTAYQPLQKRILRQNKTDVVALLTDMKTAIAADANANVMRTLRGLINIVRLQDAHKSDLARVNRSPLEFVRGEEVLATGSFLPEAKVEKSDAALKIAPFVRAEASEAIGRAIETLPGDVTDVRLVDLNLDGRLDLLFIAGETLGWFPAVRAESDKEGAERTFAELQTIVIPAGRTKLLVGDLDRDEVRRAASSAAKPTPTEQPELTAQEKLTVECEQAFPDVVVYGPGGASVVRNVPAKGDATAPRVGLGERQLLLVENPPLAEASRSFRAACLVDFDHDSDLDLVTASETGKIEFWLSLGNGSFQFESQSEWSQLPDDVGEVSAIIAVDFDRDLDLDLVVSGTGAKSLGLLENLRHGSFRWREWKEFAAELPGGVVRPLEWDGNASWDLARVGKQGLSMVTTQTPEPGKTVRLAEKSLTFANPLEDGDVHWQLGDVDNNSWQDFVYLQEGKLFYVASSDGMLQEAMPIAEGIPSGCVGVQLADWDGDGDLDAVAFGGKNCALLSNPMSKENHWLSLRLAGRADNKGRANNSGLGTLVEVRAEGRYQAQVAADQPLHFGLGAAKQADLVRLIFTNGVPQAAKQPVGDTQICERMELKGSCPFVYTFDGKERTFFTDCLWAAPLGLQTVPGETVPYRSWEYLKIPGARLQPKRQGEKSVYELCLTEELWEAAYFDQVELLAIDHPADTEVFTNEKVGPPSLSEFQIHTIGKRHVPLGARDSRGKDCLAQVIAEDEVFFRGFGELRRQGLAEEHYLELDLGDLAKLKEESGEERKLVLFLTGWIYPTDTSLNMALSQPEGEGLPKLPSLWIPDAQGEWQEVVPFTGFPGGKTKTIAVPLPLEKFAASDYRVRVVTSAEICWDAAFVAGSEISPPRVKVQSLPLQLATLGYHGFSAPLPRVMNGPQKYDYQRVSKGAKWPPMLGAFTRYGDVLELLTQSDDQMAVLGSGDELVLHFGEQAPVPEGYVRDFFLHCVGYDKDADLNTLDGQDSEPLPFAAMRNYPPRAEDAWPDSEAYRTYLEKYQTRRQSTDLFWKELLPQPR